MDSPSLGNSGPQNKEDEESFHMAYAKALGAVGECDLLEQVGGGRTLEETKSVLVFFIPIIHLNINGVTHS